MFRYLLFFPSVTFGLLTAEIFPWGILYGLSRIFRLGRISSNLALIIALLFLSSAHALIASGGDSFGETIRSLAAYMNPLLAFFAILLASDAEVVRLRRIALIVLGGFVTLGVVQFVGFATLVEPVMKLLVPRAAGESIGGSRGVTLLSSEPSRASLEFVFCYLVFRVSVTLSPMRRTLLDLGAMAFIAVVLKTATGAAFFLLVLAIFNFWLFFLSLSVAVIAAVNLLQVESRALDILFNILTSGNFTEVFKIILNQSGFRFISVYSSIPFGFLNPFGGGVGNWETTSVAAMQGSGIDPSQVSYFDYFGKGSYLAVRPPAFAANLMLDIGILGTVAFVTLLRRTVLARCQMNRDRWRVLVIFLFSFFFIGDTGSPFPWVCLAILLRFAPDEPLAEDAHGNQRA